MKADALLLAGIAALVAAAFLVALVLGLVVAGAALILLSLAAKG
jgi:hypothetical protein